LAGELLEGSHQDEDGHRGGEQEHDKEGAAALGAVEPATPGGGHGDQEGNEHQPANGEPKSAAWRGDFAGVVRHGNWGKVCGPWERGSFEWLDSIYCAAGTCGIKCTGASAHDHLGAPSASRRGENSMTRIFAVALVCAAMGSIGCSSMRTSGPMARNSCQ